MLRKGKGERSLAGRAGLCYYGVNLSKFQEEV